MKDENGGARTTHPRLLKRYEWGLATGWTLVIAALLVINIVHERRQTVETARTQARSNYQRDVIYRHWVAGHGGVYVPITANTQPNPYMADLPERDVTTTTGKRLTLINPAYMTRLVFDLSAKVYDVKGHITSMRPVRPENRPDPWETSALHAFARGEQEVSSVEKIDAESYLRLMRPLMTDRECLKCHAKDGCREGEIRGGISVAVPMQPLRNISRQNIILSTVSFTILWLAGIGGIFTGAARLSRAIRQRDRAEQEIVTLNRNLLAQTRELEAANAELEAFNYSVSHDLRKPLSVINGYCQVIWELFGDKLDERCRGYITEMYEGSLRMNRLIDTLLNFSRTMSVEMHPEMVDLSGMAKMVAAGLEMAEPERRVVFRIAEGVTAGGDASLLQIVLDNLIGNAWKYTAKQEETVITFGVTEVDGAPAYYVRDNGPGFDIADTEELFIPFRRLPGTDAEGHGIGLATVKRIIQRHGGKVWAEGKPGKGATFYFTLNP